MNFQNKPSSLTPSNEFIKKVKMAFADFKGLTFYENAEILKSGDRLLRTVTVRFQDRAESYDLVIRVTDNNKLHTIWFEDVEGMMINTTYESANNFYVVEEKKIYGVVVFPYNLEIAKEIKFGSVFANKKLIPSTAGILEAISGFLGMSYHKDAEMIEQSARPKYEKMVENVQKSMKEWTELNKAKPIK